MSRLPAPDPDAAPRVLAVCGLAFEAAIARGPGVGTVCGPAALGRPGADASAPWSGIISFGCAGALDPALAPGDCVVGRGVLCGGAPLRCDPAWTRALLARLPRARAGLVAGLDAPLVRPADKARLLHATGACAVDMESLAAARAAQRLGLPFAVVRIVLDPAWRAIPPCAVAGLRADGSTALVPLLASLARDPRQLASLCALAREAWLARRALRRVRARLGPALAFPDLPGK